jgi:transcriptional regulator with XRE-family HTH domain
MLNPRRAMRAERAEPHSIDAFYGAAIFQLRWRFRRWGQRKLAKKAGIAHSSISNYEQGRTVPDLEVRKKIACALGVPLARLHRLAAAIQGGMAGLSQDSLGYEELAGEISFDLAEDYRRGAFPLIRKLLAATFGGDTASPSPDWPALAPLVRRIGVEGLQVLLEELPELRSPAFVELLAEESEKAASDDADLALKLADLTLWLAKKVPEVDRRQCEGFAWGIVGNARRVRSDLKAARKAFSLSARLWKAESFGTPADLPGWRLLDLEASLWIDLRKPARALALLDQATEAAPQSGDSQARLWLKRSNALALMGDTEGAIEAGEKARSLLGSDSSPRLHWIVQFYLMESLCEVGRAAKAEELLDGLRALTAQIGNGLDSLRLRWLEAKIAAGVGRVAEAIAALSRVRADFAEKTIRYDEALASMELAALYLMQGRTADVKRLVRQMEPIFRAKGVHEEAKKALELFRQAVELETVTLELVRRVVAYLYRAQHNPELRFEAGG